MRLPFGILTGVGFIGGGLLRRGSLIVGVTTAATLECVTVVGPCFGCGQMLLGWPATAIAVLVLWGLRWFENFVSVEQHALFALTLEPEGPSESEIRCQIGAAAITVRDSNLRSGSGARTPTLRVSKPRHRSEAAIPALVDELSRRNGAAGARNRLAGGMK